MGLTNPKGEIRMMSALLDLAVFPGNQGGPLMHIIAAKAVALVRLYKMNSLPTLCKYKKNAKAMAAAFVKKRIRSYIWWY
jgi:glycine hydroxymethyltransferase